MTGGCGIELNTNRGNAPLPGEKWLRIYRELGGEIITLGSDAHRPRHIGCAIRGAAGAAESRAALPRFCTFDAVEARLA